MGITIENVDVFKMTKAYAVEFLERMEETLERHGYVFDLPPETLYPHEYPSDEDNRTVQRCHQHNDIKAAELFQACVDANRERLSANAEERVRMLMMAHSSVPS